MTMALRLNSKDPPWDFYSLLNVSVCSVNTCLLELHIERCSSVSLIEFLLTYKHTLTPTQTWYVCMESSRIYVNIYALDLTTTNRQRRFVGMRILSQPTLPSLPCRMRTRRLCVHAGLFLCSFVYLIIYLCLSCPNICLWWFMYIPIYVTSKSACKYAVHVLRMCPCGGIM